MTDPITAGLAANLATEVVKAGGRGFASKIFGTPKEQALRRCFHAAAESMLPEDDPHRADFAPILADFLTARYTTGQLEPLLRGESPDVAGLQDEFSFYVNDDLPAFDFETRFARFVETFILAAEQEETLRETINTAQLRTQTELLRQLVAQHATAPTFNQQTQSVTTQTNIGQIHTLILNALPPDTPADDSLTAENLARYVRNVADRHRNLEVSGFLDGIATQKRTIPPIDLDKLYIPLRLSLPRLPKDDEVGKEKPDPEKPETIPSPTLLNSAHRLPHHLAVIGEAGSGKTTILKHLCLHLAQATLTQDLRLAEEKTGYHAETLADLPLPLFVPLRFFHHYCQKHTQDLSVGQFYDFVAWYFQDRHGLDLPAGFYRTLIKSGRALLALDGFDEVPTLNARRQVAGVIRALASDHHSGQNYILLTSRTAAYRGGSQVSGFATLQVLPLEPAERAQQIDQWVAEISPYTQKKLKASDILSKMPPDSDLDKLARTPMIVTTLCVVYFYDHQLPEQRAQLYDRCIHIMLAESLRQDEPGQKLGEAWEDNRDWLARLAFELHKAQLDQVDEGKALEWLKPGMNEPEDAKAKVKARKFLETIEGRGNLLQKDDYLYGFEEQHRTFREFLAGHHLITTLQFKERQKHWAELLQSDHWREALRLAVGTKTPSDPTSSGNFLAEMLDEADKADESALSLGGYKIAAEALSDLIPKYRQRIDYKVQDRIIDGLAERLEDKSLALPELLTERVAAGKALGALGDPRLADPFANLITIPAGEFVMGSNEGQSREKPQHKPNLPEYRIGKYTVTNQEFAQFVEAGGYTEQHWWTEAGWQTRQEEKWQKPRYWDNEQFNQANQPVVGVSWYEAVAYCQWLTAKWRGEGKISSTEVVRLPTEAEWEKAARGDQDGRIYPWGDEFDSALCNSDVGKSSVGHTTAVGLYPGGASPFGLADCAGNVWEWCLTKVDGTLSKPEFKPYPYQNMVEEMSPLYITGRHNRLLRGGSGSNDLTYDFRATYRSRYAPDFGYDGLVGVRLALSC